MTRLAIVMLAAALLGGCGAAPKRGEEMMDSVRTYNDGVRWGRLANAASRVPPDEREDFVDERDELADELHITDWEVVRVKEVSDGKASVHVKYTWYQDAEGIVRETTAVQRWERRGKAWLIVEERRTRGVEMPGLAEQVDDPQNEDEGGGDGDGEQARAGSEPG
jgi:hypothetical protein